MKLPLLVSVPHAGLQVPPEVEDICILNDKDIVSDSDEGAAETYYGLAKYCHGFVASDIARALIDLNRAPDDIGGDGVIKSHTCWNVMDIYDHSMQIIETIEAFRDVTSSLYDMYLSAVSHRMNQVMKVLTVIATIFIPLTFIVGVYGMNFHYMPELAWRWGYFIILAIMSLLGIGMALYFKKKDWF